MLEILQILHSLPNMAPEDHDYDYMHARDYYPVYSQIAAERNPKSICEIGTRLGYSLIAMLHGARECQRIVWCDNESYIENSNPQALQNIQHYFSLFPLRSLPHIALWSCEPEGLVARKITADLVHVDGEHTYEGKMRDLKIAYALRPKTILCDDYYQEENRRAIDQWAWGMNRTPEIIDTFKRGMAVFRMEQ